MAGVRIETNIGELGRDLRLTAEQIQRAGRIGTEQLIDEAGVLYDRTIRTWEHKPDFVKRTNHTADRAEASINTDSKIFGFIDDGTRVRRAVMSEDWRSKTTPGRLSSGRGSGRVVFISKNISLPGIEARRFTEIIGKRISRRARGVYDKVLKGMR